MRAFRLGERAIDLGAGTVTHRGEVTSLTSIEGKLLGYLARRPGDVVSREELLVEVWEYRPGVQSRTIDNTCSRLRVKIEDDPGDPKFLHALYGRGLRLDGVEPSEGGSTVATRFVGRERELVEVTDRFRGGHRLVTLVGPAGVGKSRTAAEVLSRLSFEAVEVPCGTVRDGRDLDAAVLGALRATSVQATGRLGPLLSRSGALLLVLDECEQAVDAIAGRVVEWLADAPRLRVLATSRILLGVPREHPIVLDALCEDDSVELFLDRVRLRDPGVEGRPDVRRVVTSLEGLPLAIELAAARSHLVGLGQLVELLGAPLDVLGGQGRASMSQVVERSWDLLTPEDRRALTAASVFESPFDLDDLAAVAELGRRGALDRVESLVAQSLLRVGAGTEKRRHYALYAVVRERARRDLADDDPVFARHAAWFSRLGDPAWVERAALDKAARDTMRRAEPDLRAAVARSSSRAPDVAAQCGLALVWRLAREGPPAETLALAGPIAPMAKVARVRVMLGTAIASVHAALGDYPRAVATAEEIVALADNDRDLVLVRCGLATNRRNQGDLDGMARELELARPHLANAGAAHAKWLQVSGFYASDAVEGERLLEEAARVARRYGDRACEVATLLFLAGRVDRRGEWEELAVLHRRVLDLCGSDELPNRSRAFALASVGGLERIRGNLDAAEQMLEEAAELASRDGLLDPLVSIRLDVARIWNQRERYEDARREVEPRTWETTRPHFNTAVALMVLGDIDLRTGATGTAGVALRMAVEHARLGRWPTLEGEAQDLLAVVTGDPAQLEASWALEGSAAGKARRHALVSLLAAERGEIGAARESWEMARAEVERLDLGTQSDAVYWLDRAERAIAIRAGTLLPHRFVREG